MGAVQMKTLPRWAILLLCLSLKIALSWAFEVHVADIQPASTLLFNASLGDGWSYSLDPFRSSHSGLKFLLIDPSNGHVVLRESLKCKHVIHNPFTVYVMAKTEETNPSTNYTLMPLTVYIHGEDCYIKYRRKNSYGHHWPPTQLLSAQLDTTTRGACLPAGQHILSFNDYLPSTLRRCEFQYRLSSSSSSPSFLLNPYTGHLWTAEPLCMKLAYRILHVELESPCGTPEPHNTLPVKVVLYAKDSHMKPPRLSQIHGFMDGQVKQRLRRQTPNTPPAFPSNFYVKNVPEEQGPGFVIDTITATDPDAGDAGRITYTLLATRDGRSQNMFTIDPVTGQLSTSQKLDREGIDRHYFMITATDHGRPAQSAVASLTIHVDDSNDHSPTFESGHYAQSVSESISIGATVITVRAEDADSGQNSEIEYSILNPTDVFRIDSRLGSITTRERLDRETEAHYVLKIQASDKALVTERRTATTEVEITVLDENDNKPLFSKTSYTVDVREDIDPRDNPVIAEIKATDADEGANGLIRYSITGGNYLNTFAIDGITGQLSVLEPLDYEAMKTFRLNVRAQDGGSPARSNSTTVLVRVIDVNDNDPRFYTSLYQESVPESMPVGSTIIRVTAYDNDAGLNSAIIYTLEDAPENMPLEIDHDTGALTIARELNREETARYLFKVVAKDQGVPSRTAEATIEVSVRDINDNAPIFDPRVYNEIVSEETMPGTPVVAVTARDLDEDENARVTYSITSGNVKGAFNIMSQMGQGLITVARVLNYKEQSRYILTVQASDPGNLVDTATVFINVSDANTYRPIFQGTPYQIRVDENTAVGTSVFSVVATDQDSGENARITYTLDDNSAFEMNANTGGLTIMKPLDRETTPGYTLTVTASDNGRPRRSDTTDIEVVVADVNDNAPKFLRVAYEGRVQEDAIVGTSILTISATDEDIGLNGRIRYTFEGGDSGNGDFMLDPTLGILRTNKELDREKIGLYELRAFAVDRGAPVESSSVIITIVVEDVNDNSPQFESPNLDLYVPENSPIGTKVGEIEAVDPDEAFNANVEYSIIGGTDAGSFSLQTTAGRPASITTLVELDYEGGKKEYQIVVRARSYHLFSDASVTIYVQDINDNEPQLKDFLVIFNNYKDHFPTGGIGKIPAFDPDVSDKLHYKFISGNQANLLHLDENTGDIRLDGRLNSDVPTNATLQVSVTDGINEVKAICRLFVRLVTKDMLDNSITIRLSNIDQKAFLSPLYSMFISALANIIPTTEDNVFIINVQDDIEVKEKILNISFSVRQRKDSIKDVFYSSQFLRERVYLQRVLLAKLSTLEVLPFDDNLCVIEPCLNFDECLTFLRFGNASSFITSDTMLFRPIHPTNYFKCQCPQWFTGMSSSYLCDTEVNLCYSDPCRNEGTCVQREGGYTCLCKEGFTGDQCEFDMAQTKTCPDNLCKSGSSCIPLIRGGFRCERCLEDDGPGNPESKCEPCSNVEHHTKFCELTTRSFPKGSFLLYPSLKRRHRFGIRLSFATRERNALLFYNGRYNEKHDFIALEIVEGQVQFSFSLGSEITTVKADFNGGVNDGNWHQVTLGYLNRTATLTVGDWCDTQLSIKHGRQIGDYSCANQVTQVLEARCSDVTETCHRFLDLTGPLQLGGLPSLPSEFQIQNKDFVGCMKEMYIDEEFVDMNDYVWNSNTMEGCPEKKSYCVSDPCQNKGTCFEAWGTYRCECKDGWGGKDCSLKIDPPRSFVGNSYIKFLNHGLNNVRVPWYNGISFRTRQTKASLMEIVVGAGTRNSPKEKIHINIANGNVHYNHSDKKTIVLDGVIVNDGKWHYLEARWQADNTLLITLDYGQIRVTEEMGDWVNGLPVGEITVGGIVSTVGANVLVTDGFQGCAQDIRVGNSANSVLMRPGQLKNAAVGCEMADACQQDAFPCPDNSYCNNEWGDHTCTCEYGRIGATCDRICEKYNPCVNGAACKDDNSAPDGYVCECLKTYTGKYCEKRINEQCPANWYSGPNGICGPCDCPTHRGFDPHCNITSSGEKKCFCKENHYRPPGSHVCFPCDCYGIGSDERHCDQNTGQCHCKPGVIGRRCDSCSSKFAQVTERGCEVVYDSCPRSFMDGIWWDRTHFSEEEGVDNVKVSQNCPTGSTGVASRVCNRENGWGEPDLFNCRSVTFDDLARQLKLIDSRDLLINTFVSKSLITSLNETTNMTYPLYGADVNTTFHLIRNVLAYENHQTGLNLTHKQDRNFIQNLVNSVGQILRHEYKKSWDIIQRDGGGTAELMAKIESYTQILAKNMPQLFTEPFDAIHDNVVIGLDYIGRGNFSSHIALPKFNNKVKTEKMFDEDTRVILPAELVKGSGSRVEVYGGQEAVMIVSYAMFKTLGDLLPAHYDEDTVRVLNDIPLSVNSPVFTLNLLAGNKSVKSSLEKSIVLDLKQLQSSNRSSPQCAYYKYSTDSRRDGVWSTKGCVVEERRTQQNKSYVTCSCNHLTSFGVLMDMSSEEVSTAQSIGMEIITYVGLSVSLLLLLAAMILFCCLRGMNSNSNSIHINLVFCIFVSHLTFLVGINRTEPKIGCKIVAITLHYFYMSVFAWMFVEALHLYRMMTEIRNINQGSMKFYYLIGYVIPGIIAGLAVGLNTDGYGNSRFCWLDTREFLIWSFAGPVCCMICINIVVVIMALRASCQKAKQADPEFKYLKYGLRASIMLLPLLGLAWVFGLLAVNDNVATFHYLFAIFSLLQGLFIFLVYIMLCKETRRQLHYTWHKMKGEKLDESMSTNHQRGRSALSYHRGGGDSSLEGGINRFHIGVSTTSSTSHSTSKSSGGMYHPDGYLHTSSTSTSGHVPTHCEYPPAAGIPAYGYDSSAFHDKPVDDPDTGEVRPGRKRRDTDSDSELSAMEHPDMELASSHSSDDDEEDGYGWNKNIPKSKLIDANGRVALPPKQTGQVSPREEKPPPVPPHPAQPPQNYSVNNGYQHSPTRSPPPYTSLPTTPQKWPGEGLSTTTAGSDTEHMSHSPNHIKISEKMPLNGILKNGSNYREREPISPPERTDSLPPNYDSSSGRSPRSPRDRMTVKVLTHNGSISESESASSFESGDYSWGRQPEL